jgi:RNA polymerase-binding transcription factor DksA
MATKKPAAKAATKKPAPKPAPKKAAKPAPKPVKKAAPAKKAVKPAPKPAPKKVVKPAAKPAPKAAKPVAKPAPKKAAKPVAKPVAKSAPAKKPAKPIVKPVSKAAKPVAKPIAKPVAKEVAKKLVAVAPKKPDLKKITPKAPEKVPAKAAEKAPVAAKAIAKNPKDIKVAPPKPVVIPKINTKTSRKYSPDFTKSVLDELKNDPGAPIVRYSDNDLQEFRELIQRKLGAAKKELAYLQGLITRKDEMGGDESDNRYMTMEDGSLSMEREQLSQMASRQITFIDHLEKALMRIENKTYGICRVTGKLIDKARLRAVPHATLSIEAKMGIVK